MDKYPSNRRSGLERKIDGLKRISKKVRYEKMMYIDFTAGDKAYKLRLSIRATVALEKQLGVNPLMIFGNGDTIPTITVMVNVLHAALQQYHHGISVNDAYDIFEAWLNDGNSITDFLPIIIEVYKVSGIIKQDGETEKN
jgi:hypothetical protein